MATKGPRSSQPLVDQRRSPDRRAAPREGQGSARGRRATDLVDARATTAGAGASSSGRKRRSTRDGRQPLVIYLRPEAIKALKIAALERDSTASAIMADVLDAWLERQRPGRR